MSYEMHLPKYGIGKTVFIVKQGSTEIEEVKIQEIRFCPYSEFDPDKVKIVYHCWNDKTKQVVTFDEEDYNKKWFIYYDDAVKEVHTNRILNTSTTIRDLERTLQEYKIWVVRIEEKIAMKRKEKEELKNERA